MKLRTKYPDIQSKITLNFNQPLFFAGSCFAENMAKKFQAMYWDVVENPLGISYNPISLFKQLKKQNPPNSQEWTLLNGIYSHPDFHSDLNDIHLENAIEKVKHALEIQKDGIQKCEVLFLTLGTAWVHIRKTDEYLVNNCHKQTASLFEKRILKVEEIVEAWKDCLQYIETTFTKKFQVVFSLSPVRHIKDGFRENQISKSTLHLACEEISKIENCHYFPAYEIVLDDLRDYRFYKEDLVHPNAMAIDYIWDYFQKAYFSDEVKNKCKELESLVMSSNHKAFHTESEAHQKFLKDLLEKLGQFQDENKIDLTKLKARLKQQLLAN